MPGGRTGALATGSFTALIAGANLPVPLLPVYRDVLGLTPTGVALVFSSYLVVLVATLAVMSRVREGPDPWWLLAAALGCALVADGLLLVGSMPGLLLGRLVTGIAIGLGTGAASSIMLSVAGEPGRTVAATGNLVGALVGTAGAAAAAQWLPAPTRVVFVVHAAGVVVLTFAVVIRTRPAPERARDVVPVFASAPASLGDENGPGRCAWSRDASRWWGGARRRGGYGLGILAWTVAGLVVALVPTTLVAVDAADSVIAATGVVVVFLVAAAVTQFAWPATRSGVVAALVLVGAGMATLVWAIAVSSLLLALLGCAVTGLGQGPSYRSGMAMVSRGSSSAALGRLASAYACVSYATAAVAVVVAGMLLTASGMR